MESLETLIKIISAITGIGVFIVTISKIIVNYFTAHELDRLFSNGWKSFTEVFAVSFMISSIITLIIFDALIEEIQKEWTINILLLIMIDIIIAIGVFSIYKFGVFLYSELCSKGVYYVELTDALWQVVQAKDNTSLYIKNGDKQKILIDMNNITFIRKNEQSDLAKSFFKLMNKVRYFNMFMLLGILVSCVSLLFIIGFNNYVLTGVPLFFIILFSILLVGNRDYHTFLTSDKQKEQM